MDKKRIIAVSVLVIIAVIVMTAVVADTEPAIPQLVSISSAKLTGGYVFLSGKVVTAVIEGLDTHVIYIQEPRNSQIPYSGIKVVLFTRFDGKPGDLVDLWGFVTGGVIQPECQIIDALIITAGTGSIPAPIAVTGLSAAGGSFGWQPALYRKTPDRIGYGLSPIGARVKVWGRVTWTDGENVCFVDDGSDLKSVYNGAERTGLRLIYQAKCPHSPGDFVIVTGVLGAEMSEDNCPVPVVRVDTPEISNPQINIISTNLSSYPYRKVPCYSKFELTFTINDLGQPFVDYNPFNPNTETLSSGYWDLKGVRVDIIFTSPSGETIEWPCFWYEGSDGWVGWKARFAPTEVGTWMYCIKVNSWDGVVCSGTESFECGPAVTKGFVSVSPQDNRYFQFSNGEIFVPLGVNLMGWSGYPDLKAVAEDCLPLMAANGGNSTRILSTSTNIEVYHDTSKYLNKYNMARARQIDAVMAAAEANGVYIEWCLDDWTWLKNNPDGTVANRNQYLKSYNPTTGDLQRDAPCSTVEEFFSSSVAREIYKRKLRYWMARWGYSPNLMCIELINEVGLGGSNVSRWHQDMANFIRGDDNAVPSSWGSGDIQDLNAQPCMISSSNGSTELRTTAGIPWNGTGDLLYDSIIVDGAIFIKPGMDFVNYHDYARPSISWTSLGSKCPSPLEQLGSTLEKPWHDTAVWADRTGRVYHKKLMWSKPFWWSEYGLIKVDSTGWHDWNDAYYADVTARHFRDTIWPGVFCSVYVHHSKIDYIRGGGAYSAGGSKFWAMKPLANFIAGEDLRWLHQETAYPNLITPVRLECSNPNVLVMVMAGTDRAYLYVKNLTDVWYRIVDPTAESLLEPSEQSAIVRIYGLMPGNYTLEQWSTSQPDKSAQVLSTQTIVVPQYAVAEIPVTVGTGLTSGYDCAFKLKKH